LQAVETAALEKVMILTGGPGTGKTFTVRTIVTLWKAMGKKIACAAPTGRAAKRLSEMTGIEAKTLHREPVSMKATSDCLWHNGGTEAEHGVQTICDLIEHYIPHVGFNPATDVQVLCPMTRGLVGTFNLNKVLQQLINPAASDKAELARGDSILRTGD
jgi:ATP-dependent exoDNAse (exonuclease V) alpha subunit